VTTGQERTEELKKSFDQLIKNKRHTGKKKKGVGEIEQQTGHKDKKLNND